MEASPDKPSFNPFEFVPFPGSNVDLSAVKGSALVLSSMSAGMSASIAQDLYILNEKPQKLGYIKTEYMSPMVQNSILSNGKL